MIDNYIDAADGKYAYLKPELGRVLTTDYVLLDGTTRLVTCLCRKCLKKTYCEELSGHRPVLLFYTVPDVLGSVCYADDCYNSLKYCVDLIPMTYTQLLKKLHKHSFPSNKC